ncbi:major facilitator superfamily domain-containing protein [Immersiella caudata]|uniref:Major facilitator superfamily domain-containing protein n=1 Tax=Immersiella caudata TaxID=314043 RepID=A0AA39WVZ9_9PEZI|nr:major facilitator superfamily domain-containing protein [Immersiella caudata]
MMHFIRRRKNRGFLGHDSSALTPEEEIDRQQLRFGINLNSWNLRIWAVAASGFLTGSYNLFATNVVYASIAFVYFPNERWPGLLMNATTLVGSIIGQVLFGFLADLFGRSNLYGVELVIVVISTLGLAFSGTGYQSMSFLGLFTFWRFVTGVGLGAEFITAEWSSTSARATMIATVFLMQPVGQALAQIVNVAVLLGRDQTHSLQDMRCGLDTKYEFECRQIIDGIWRIVIGVGAAPALIAILFRFFLPDSGLYNLEVRQRAKTALTNNVRVFGQPSRPFNAPNGTLSRTRTSASSDDDVADSSTPVQFSRKDLHRYFIRDGNWMYLLGAAATWFILDVALYGFGLDNRATIADLWATQYGTPIDSNLECWASPFPDGNSAVPGWIDGLPIWQTDRTRPCDTIYDVLLQQAKQYLITVSIGSLLGCICFVIFVNKIPRRQFLTSSFIFLTALFTVTGGVYYGVHHGPYAPTTAVLVGFCHFAFNFGANSLTFLIPAEIFPTAYRCFCHGVSAAAGKLGSVIAIFMVYGINTGYHSATKQGLVFLLFAFVGAIGAIFSWAYLPDIQIKVDGVLMNRDLEELSEGMLKARMQGQVFGIKEKWQGLRWRIRTKMNRGQTGGVSGVIQPMAELPA